MTKEYKEICLAIWGCIPTDTDWAENTNYYKETLIIYNETRKKILGMV